MKLARVLLAALLALAAGIADPQAPWQGPPVAHASVSLAVTMAELVERAELVVVGVAMERRSQWESVGGGKRIVTYTRVDVERAVYGAAPAELWVRTLGGVVDRIGQQVAGEPRLAIGERTLLFLTPSDGAYVVAARAQGHFRVLSRDDGKQVLHPSPDSGTLVPRKDGAPSAQKVLAGRELAPGVRHILELRDRIRPPR